MMLVAEQRRKKLPVQRAVVDDKDACHIISLRSAERIPAAIPGIGG
jgi:hypothetical protein